MSILAVDPGTTQSGWVILDGGNEIASSGVNDNLDVLDLIRDWPGVVAIERFEARGMAIGDDSVETILWTGRFIQAASQQMRLPVRVRRSEVKSYLCGTQQAKDTNIRQALIDLFPPTGGGKTPQVGTKSKPGPLFGVTSHAWAALGVAATVRKLERTA